MKVKVVTEFRDKTSDFKLRKVDEILTVSDERGKMLIGRQLAEEVKERKHIELPKDVE